MSDAYVQVAPDDTTGKKIQTYENMVGLNDVHAQAVVLVDSGGVPYTPLTSFESVNTARVDPSGHDSGSDAGVVGDLSKPFLTVQGAINAIEALIPIPGWPVIDIGNNDYVSESLTTSLKTLVIQSTNTGNIKDSSNSNNTPINFAFNSLTFTEATNPVSFVLKDCCAVTIVGSTANVAKGFTVYLIDSDVDAVYNNVASGHLNIYGYGGAVLRGLTDLGGNGTIEVHDIPNMPEGFGNLATSTISFFNCPAVPAIDSGAAQLNLVNSGLFDVSSATFPVAVKNPKSVLIANPNVAIAPVGLFSNAGVPDATVGVGLANKGSLCMGTGDGKLYINGGNAAIPNWGPINSAITPNVAGAVGTILRSNGTNYISSLPAYPNTANAGRVLIGDGTNVVLSTPAFPNASATSGKIIKSDGTNWIASTETFAAPGTSGNIATSNGTNWTSNAPAAAAAGTLTGVTLASGVTASSLTSFGNSPTLVTPILGTPTSGTLSSCGLATDSVAGVMSAADHTTLTGLSVATATGVAPAFVGIGVPCFGFKSGIDLKSNATTDIFTVPTSRTFVCSYAIVLPTTVTASTATTFTFKIIESGASAAMTTVAAAANVAAATTKEWAQNATAPATGPYFNCAAGNKVQLNISTAAAGTTVTGSVFVFGCYIT